MDKEKNATKEENIVLRFQTRQLPPPTPGLVPKSP